MAVAQSKAVNEKATEHPYKGVWESPSVPDARFEVRPNGEFVGGLWLGPRQPLGVVAPVKESVKEGATAVPVNLIQRVEIEYQISTPFAKIQRKLSEHQSLVEVKFKTDEREWRAPNLAHKDRRC